jgi:hypothetical protein
VWFWPISVWKRVSSIAVNAVVKKAASSSGPWRRNCAVTGELRTMSGLRWAMAAPA